MFFKIYHGHSWCAKLNIRFLFNCISMLFRVFVLFYIRLSLSIFPWGKKESASHPTLTVVREPQGFVFNPMWCEALSFKSPSGGPFGWFWGVLLRLFFFAFNPMFSSSKRPPETKASQYQEFQTMRNSILLTIFLQDHGICRAKTDFGPILVPFWIEFSKYLSERIRID